jgi:hypothetical protein
MHEARSRRWFRFGVASCIIFVAISAVCTHWFLCMASKIAGTWRSPPEPGRMLESEWGPTRLTMTLGAKGEFQMITEFGREGAHKDTGRYVIDGDRFVSSEVDGGQPCKISLEGNVLVLTLSDGEAFRFARGK